MTRLGEPRPTDTAAWLAWGMRHGWAVTSVTIRGVAVARCLEGSRSRDPRPLAYIEQGHRVAQGIAAGWWEA